MYGGVPLAQVLLLTSRLLGSSVAAPPQPTPLLTVIFAMPIAKGGSRTQWPPVSRRKNETDEEMRQRLSGEAKSKRISDRIDRQLDEERQQRSKDVGPKILLLGTCHALSLHCGS